MANAADLDEATAKFIADHQKEVDKIVQLESEADSLTGEADSFRAQAAGMIVGLLEGGATERAVAQAIGKSDSHVHHAKVAWLMMQGDTTIEDFNTAYKLAKRPPAQRNAANTESSQGEGDNAPDTNSAQNPFPAWAPQLRELNRLCAEMTEQASHKQVKQLAKALEKHLRAAIKKQEALESQEESS